MGIKNRDGSKLFQSFQSEWENAGIFSKVIIIRLHLGQ